MCRYSMDLAICAGDSGCCGSVWLYTRNRSACDNHKSDEPTCPDAVVSMCKFEVLLGDLPEMRCFLCTEKIALPRLSLPDRTCGSSAPSVIDVSEPEKSLADEDDDSYMVLPQNETKGLDEGALTDEESIYSDELEDTPLPEGTAETSSFVEPVIHDQDDDRWFVSAGYGTTEQPTPIDDTFWGATVDHPRAQPEYPGIVSPDYEESLSVDHDFRPSMSVASRYDEPTQDYVYSPNIENEEKCHDINYQALIWPPVEKKSTHTRSRNRLSSNFTRHHEQASKIGQTSQKVSKSGHPKVFAASKTAMAPAELYVAD